MLRRASGLICTRWLRTAASPTKHICIPQSKLFSCWGPVDQVAVGHCEQPRSGIGEEFDPMFPFSKSQSIYAVAASICGFILYTLGSCSGSYHMLSWLAPSIRIRHQWFPLMQMGHNRRCSWPSNVLVSLFLVNEALSKCQWARSGGLLWAVTIAKVSDERQPTILSLLFACAHRSFIHLLSGSPLSHMPCLRE